MIIYGSIDVKEVHFINLRASADVRDHQWMDVTIQFELAPGSELPEGMEELTALLICTHNGDIVQIVPQDEGRDCEFQFTEQEKQQLSSFYTEQVRPRLTHYLA